MEGAVPDLPRRTTVTPGVDLIVADVRAGLAIVPDASVQCIVSSPPYLGLRDYGIAPVAWPAVTYRPRYDLPEVEVPAMMSVLGAEPSMLAFVGHLVLVARALRRVLRDDGVFWMNLGASYATGTTSKRNATTTQGAKVPSGWAGRCDMTRWTPEGLPAKNIIPSPWAAAEALQADGWVLRSEIIWHKANPMPEAVRDRPTVSHEQVFLLAKQGRYFYDADAIAEPLEHPEASTPDDMARAMTRRRRTAAEARQEPLDAARYRSGNVRAKTGAERGRPGDHRKASIPWEDTKGTRNARSVWSIPTQPYRGAHFATFPERLAQRCILAGSRPSDLVLDCFAGSGTVGAVAKTLGRDALLIEASPVYAAEQLVPRVTKARPYQPELGGAR